MKEFKKYQHIERFGTTEVEGIEFGDCYVFPKIDGTNASVWVDENGNIQAGSRKRHLSLEDDNADFYKWVKNQENIKSYLKLHPTHRLFGEWLVPHSLRTYRSDAWNRFYVFDVMVHDDLTHSPYEDYKPILEEYNIDYIPCIAKIHNGTKEQFIGQLEKNTFLIEDGKGVGEGIVIKNYDYTNKFGRQTWAKIVSSEFKEKHFRQMGPTEIKGKYIVEEKISEKYVTKALCEKVVSKIKLDNNGFSSKDIPRLLNTVYHDVVREDCWNFIKELKDPVIDFKKLRQFVVLKIKQNLPELF